MEKKGIVSLKNLKISIICMIVLDFIIAVLYILMAKYGHSSYVEILLFSLYGVLIPVTAILIILTFINNMKKSYTEKRTAKQELDIKQKFWGRIDLIVISAVITFVCTLFIPFELYGVPLMFLLFVLSILLGPYFGRLIIKK